MAAVSNSLEDLTHPDNADRKVLLNSFPKLI